jgi:hypothetical protein
VLKDRIIVLLLSGFHVSRLLVSVMGLMTQCLALLAHGDGAWLMRLNLAMVADAPLIAVIPV